jgi:hypothetical protein
MDFINFYFIFYLFLLLLPYSNTTYFFNTRMAWLWGLLFQRKNERGGGRAAEDKGCPLGKRGIQPSNITCERR